MGILFNHNKNLGFTKFPFFLIIVLLFVSCGKKSESSEPYRKPSSGPINLVSVFSSDELYKEIKPTLEDSLLFGRVFPGLYYPAEIMFGTRHFEENTLNRFNSTRLILNLKLGAPEFIAEKNKFAKPQGYVEVHGNDTREIADLLHKNQDSIINLYRWADREFLLESYASKAKASTPNLDAMGVSLLVPKDYQIARAEKNFVWYRKDQVNTITNRDARNNLVNKSSFDIINILVYKVPFNKPNLNLQEFIQISDSITGLYTEGGKEPKFEYIKNGNDSMRVEVKDHVTVEKNPAFMDSYDFTPLPSPAPNLLAYESQGWWSMTLSQMGGPYTSKILLDKKNHTLYVAQAILFAPLNQGKSKKRDYITAMEGLFTTFKLK
ncbi:DUF4837 family protein [Ornithobacterium rhinotracheale]|uniref:DUF4837 family protein n=1 Tax=Ornithobacterium rhinotracheale TaxID=28251 RepID=A0A3R5WYR8_ORNRH|nr:DUF4837 family protein [Ornithobacterium rhinotracheale]QAR30190.1 DUF4837 family protein [Ornithobacterium rhinotracheale]